MLITKYSESSSKTSKIVKINKYKNCSKEFTAWKHTYKAWKHTYKAWKLEFKNWRPNYNKSEINNNLKPTKNIQLLNQRRQHRKKNSNKHNNKQTILKY